MSLLLAGFLAVQAQVEKIEIPGTKVSFEVARIPATGPLRTFRMGTREVTWSEYRAYRDAPAVDAVTRPTIADSYFGTVGITHDFLEKGKPVINVRWHGGVGYCDWLTWKTGGWWRLPTEPEWEAAARAGRPGAGPEAPDEEAWHAGTSGRATHAGGTRKPNALGLHDLFGNVWEYVLEFEGGTEYRPLVKGGCWSTSKGDLTFAGRASITEDWLTNDPQRPQSVWWLGAKGMNPGFRVVCAAEPSTRAARESYLPKVAVRVLSHREKVLLTGTIRAQVAEVSVEATNGGDRTLEDLEVLVYFLTPGGKPHPVDVVGANQPGQATFSKAWPALSNSAHEAARVPIKPGERRTFAVDVPMSFDENGVDVAVDCFEAKATNVRFAP